MQAEPKQSSIDIAIFKLKKQNLEWIDIANNINDRFQTQYSHEDICKRYQTMTSKVSNSDLSLIFKEFQICQTNYREIASRTNLSVFQVKQHIMAGLANNIARVCLIVRKRRISTLTYNFVSNERIKELVINMLKSSILKKVKEEYRVLWGFISKHYEDSYYQTVCNEEYTFIYRQLIILVQSLRVNTYEEEHSQSVHPDSFEKKIIRIRQPQNYSSSNYLDFLKHGKKTRQSMINLVSEDQNSDQNEDNSQMFGVEVNSEPEGKAQQNQEEKYEQDEREEEERQEKKEEEEKYEGEDGQRDRKKKQDETIFLNDYLRQSILLLYNLQLLEQRRMQEPQNEQLKEQTLETIVRLGSLRLLASRGDGV